MRSFFLFGCVALVPVLHAASAHAQPSVTVRQSSFDAAALSFELRDGAAGCRKITISVNSTNTKEWSVNWDGPTLVDNGTAVGFNIEDRCTPGARLVVNVTARDGSLPVLAKNLASGSVDLALDDARVRRCTEDSPGHSTCVVSSGRLVFSGDWLRVGEVARSTDSARFPREGGGWDYSLSKFAYATAKVSFSISAAEYEFEFTDAEAAHLEHIDLSELMYRF